MQETTCHWYGRAFALGRAHTGRLLKGTKPAELPAVQANNLELVVNAETPRILGLNVPPPCWPAPTKWSSKTDLHFNLLVPPISNLRRPESLIGTNLLIQYVRSPVYKVISGQQYAQCEVSAFDQLRIRPSRRPLPNRDCFRAVL